MFRRFFFLWFGFFTVCGVGGASIVLYHRWRSVCLLEEAEAKALTATCLHQFSQQQESNLPPDEWNWDLLTRTWNQELTKPHGFALMNSVAREITYSTGVISTAWNPIVHDPGDRNTHWISLDTGERFWTVLPSPATDPQFRLWVAFGQPLSFSQFLHQRSHTLGAEAFALMLAFVLFYRWLGSPTRFLTPLIETLQRSLERADSPLRIDPSSVPGEFAPLAKTLSLLLEARQRDYEEKMELSQKVDHFSDQKVRYSTMVSRLKTLREDEQSAVERIQSALLEANREPALILDRNRRILMMNESARRVLALAGQTGSTLRHLELEAILNQEMQQTTRGGTYRLTTKDLFLGKTFYWRVRILCQTDWREPGQVQTIVLYLTQENPESPRTEQKERGLFASFGEALEEAWSPYKSRSSYPLGDQERHHAENLLRLLVSYQPCLTEAGLILTSLSATPQAGDSLGTSVWNANGSPPVWKAFGTWLGSLLEEMGGRSIESRFQGAGEEALRIEWKSSSPLPFNDWILGGDAHSVRFRRELLQQTLERLQSRLLWHPSTPGTVVLEIGAKQQQNNELPSYSTPA